MLTKPLCHSWEQMINFSGPRLDSAIHSSLLKHAPFWKTLHQIDWGKRLEFMWFSSYFYWATTSRSILLIWEKMDSRTLNETPLIIRWMAQGRALLDSLWIQAKLLICPWWAHGLLSSQSGFNLCIHNMSPHSLLLLFCFNYSNKEQPPLSTVLSQQNWKVWEGCISTTAVAACHRNRRRTEWMRLPCGTSARSWSRKELAGRASKEEKDQPMQSIDIYIFPDTEGWGGGGVLGRWRERNVPILEIFQSYHLEKVRATD